MKEITNKNYKLIHVNNGMNSSFFWGTYMIKRIFHIFTLFSTSDVIIIHKLSSSCYYH